MRPKKQPKSKKLIAVFDIESKDDDTQKEGFTRPYLLDFFDGRNHRSFRNDISTLLLPWKSRHYSSKGLIDKFLSWLFSSDTYKATNYIIYAHNGGKFDFLFFVGWLFKNPEYRFSVVSVSGRIQCLKIWRHGEDPKKDCWEFRDSICIVPLSLEEFGKTFQLKVKKDTSVDLNLHEESPIIEQYCRIDNETLFEGLAMFTDIIHKLGGTVGITAPSTSMNLFRAKYQKDDINNYKHFEECDGKCKGCELRNCDGTCHGCLHAFVRKAYYGGRTELFIRRGRGLNYFDINSSYPFSMIANVPVGECIELHEPTIKEIESYHEKGMIGIVECDVFIPKNCKVPPLPFRSEELKKLIFPVGYLTGTWDYAELKLLNNPLVEGKILKIYKAVFWEARPVFREMIRSLFKFRDKNSKANYVNGEYNTGLDFIAKLLMNSLYGKFGMNPARTAIVYCDPKLDYPEDGWPIDGDHENCQIWEREEIADVDYINPIIAEHITARSRITLYEGMLQILAQKKNVYYCDTDSLITDGVIDESTKLGGWKLEEPGILLEFESEGPKWYRFRFHKKDCKFIFCPGCKMVKVGKKKGGEFIYGVTKQRMKGVGGKAQTSDNYDRMKKGETVTFVRIMQHKQMFRSIVKNKETGNYSPTVIDQKKTMKSKYNKRIMDQSGHSKAIFITKEAMLKLREDISGNKSEETLQP